MDATEIPPLLAFSFLSKMFYKVNIVEGKTIKWQGFVHFSQGMFITIENYKISGF